LTAAGLVIFDCDGVLVDSMGIDMRELTRAIESVGGTMTAEQVDAAFHGVALADIRRGV
jgi:beta-phosphoglucomutase-like phosphatase (HAD superfamily)